MSTRDEVPLLPTASAPPRGGTLGGLERQIAREAVREALFGHRVPRTVGRYRIDRRCGRGAMGAVFEAWDPELDRKVALKLLERSRSTAESFERLERQVLHEARAMARLHHPSVVGVYEVGHHDPWLFIAMEFVGGPSLRQWLQRERPAWRAIVSAFVEVGSGLATAHRAGLAHGDFKPDNLRFDERGQLRILDFGLARSISATASVVSVDLPRSPAALLSSTGIEGFGGTPVYASPERIDGGPADPPSDQFAFFVSLFECLTGERPFLGSTLEELARAIVRGPNPARAYGPKRLRRIIERGVAERPEHRHPSMDEAVAALRRLLRARPRRWMMGAGVIGAAAASGFAIATIDRGPDCPTPAEQLEGVWSSQRDAVLAGRPERKGAADATKVEAAIARYVEGWAEASHTACTTAEPQADPDGTAAALACVGRGRVAVERLIVRLRRGDPRSWERALQAVADLPAMDGCDEATLGDPRWPSLGPDEQAKVEEIRDTLAVAEVDADAGDLDGAVASAREAVAKAEDLGFAPVQAEALGVLGELLADLGRLTEAATTLRAAHGKALGTAHLPIAADTAVALVYVDGHLRADAAMGHHWAWVARQILAEDESLRGLMPSLVANEAAVLFEEARYREADAAFAEAMELERGRPQPDPVTLDGLMHNRGVAAAQAGDYERALEIHREVLERRRELYGEGHPQVARALSSMAWAERSLGQLEEALAHDREAVERLERAYGEDTPALQSVLLGLAQSHLATGRYDEAEAVLRRVLAILERHLEAGHPNVARAKEMLGTTLTYACRYDEASALYDQVEAQLRARGDRDEQLAIARHNFAELRRRQGRHAEARALEEQAIEYWQQHDAPLQASYPRTGLAYDELALGRYAAALEMFEAELATRQRLGGPRSVLAAEAEAGLGRALHGLGRLDEAITALRRALAIYDEHEGPHVAARMSIAQWLSDAYDEVSPGLPEARALREQARAFWTECGDARKLAELDAGPRRP